MIAALARKAGQVVRDPVLRRWLFGRSLGRWPGQPTFTAHLPPYLNGLLPIAAEAPANSLPEERLTDDGATLSLRLPGHTVEVAPRDEAALFDTTFDDREVALAVHRFAWLPLQIQQATPSAVARLWRAWWERHGNGDDQWAWHPYTAAERALNLLAYWRRFGVPEPAAETASRLAAHAPAIARRLEYFGEHHTSNHLANNGRGLFLLGLGLGLPGATEAGSRILQEEARRIFATSGVLREGSTHYHLLLARAYAEAWLAARAAGRPDADAFEAIARRAVAVAAWLTLPGGLPRIGDVSPDCPPRFLAGIVPGGPRTGGWLDWLEDAHREAFLALRDGSGPADDEALRRDGWLRREIGPWSGLWHAAPEGWSHMPGHGHQDCGAFELHHGTLPLFVDPGRGAYGETGEAALYRSAAVHGGLVLDDAEPYPPNKPYYDDAFRRAIGGPPPRLESDGDGVRLTHDGFRRLSGGGTVARRWNFKADGFALDDTVEGSGRHTIVRRLVTTLSAQTDGDDVRLVAPGAAFAVRGDGPVAVSPATYWEAYGEGRPATILAWPVEARLPWRGRLEVRVL